MKAIHFILVVFILILGFSHSVTHAHEGHLEKESSVTLLKDWIFWPDYTLMGSAKNYPGPRPEIIKPYIPTFGSGKDKVFLFGQNPTEQFNKLLSAKLLENRSFSMELWLNDHVNKPVGVMASVMDESQKTSPIWALGYFDRQVFFGAPNGVNIDIEYRGLGKQEGHDNTAKNYMAYKKRWHHLIGSYDGKSFSLYHNGVLLKKVINEELQLSYSDTAELVISAYLDNEPYMDIGNLLQYAAIYDGVLTQSQAEHKFEKHTQRIKDGRLFDDLFHYSAGPYLNAGTESSMNILWETDRVATAVIEWGKQIPYDNRLELNEKSRLQTVQLKGLKSDTPYFYRITSKSNEQVIDSGALTFRTMPTAGKPITFAVIGDTEARPFVNDQIAKQLWGERPHFNVIVGDLTDGGQNNHRFEWTHEYFLGMNQVASRIPFIAAPGNGESDLVWYQHYHNLPNNEYYYSYRVGDAEFFMLDSNMGHHDVHRPGFRDKQKAWLEQALKNSTAKWKFAGHHHPVYSSDEDDYGDTYKEKSENGDQSVRDDFLTLYEKYDVDMVFFGHLHSYERTWPIKNGRVDRNGVIYVQSGGAGGNHEEASPTRNWFTKRVYSGYHYVLIHIEGDELQLISIDSEGRQRDQYSLTRK